MNESEESNVTPRSRNIGTKLIAVSSILIDLGKCSVANPFRAKSRVQFCHHSNMILRLMDFDGISNNIQDKNHKIHELVRVVNPDHWNVEEAVVPWKDAEEKLPDFCKVFRHEISVNDFRDYVENVTRNYHKHFVPETIQGAKNIFNTIAVSSAEAQRGFYVMNTIYSDKRNRLEVKNLANLLVINLIHLPLDLWDCSDSVRMWLRNHNTADDTRVQKHHTSEQKYDENRISMWKYLSK